jgi:hypothetical protein
MLVTGIFSTFPQKPARGFGEYVVFLCIFKPWHKFFHTDFWANRGFKARTNLASAELGKT